MGLIIYLAAPLFTQAERLWNIKLAEAITRKRNDITLKLPQNEVYRARIPGEFDFQKLFNICIEGIDQCDILLAILDGADSDSGTCFECGYGFAKGKRIIGVRTDIRKGEDQDLNAMLTRSCGLISFDASGEDPEIGIEKLAGIIIKKIFNK